mmetsp:Transcript_29167/g.45716  ORF Transcript_29167/g.45716 Transcript_29167/m.45716 type:complete len:131 (+) Transcript_29167:2003-2395(+)
MCSYTAGRNLLIVTTNMTSPPTPSTLRPSPTNLIIGESIVKKPTSELDEVSATMSLNPTPSESQSPDNSIHRGDLARHIELEPRICRPEGTIPTKKFKEFALDIISQGSEIQLAQPMMSEAPCDDKASDQ